MTPRSTYLLPLFALGLVAGISMHSGAQDTSTAPMPPIVCPDLAAAEDGSAMDQFYLGKAYDDGICNTPVSKEDAEHWYRKAAEQGHTLAQYELADTFFAGDGFPTDYPEAKKWYLKAAEQGHGMSELRLGFLSAEAHFKGLTTDYTAAESWFKKAAEKDAGDARFRLGNFYNNYKTPPDYANGFLWLKRAAEGGHRIAMFDVARMLIDGKGRDKDVTEGLKWMNKAADADVLQAQMALAEMYADGKNVPKDIRKALKWILTLAGKPTASVFYLNRAGDIFFEGWETVPKNYPTARKFYERAAAKNDPHALERLAEIYEKGLGVEKDAAKSIEFKNKASASGTKR